jgi:hypothetical protein
MLLAFVGESAARDNGTADPLGLISSAVIQPFWNLGADFTIVEITSPVWFNNRLHGFWFNAACNKVVSFPAPVTRNDIHLIDTDLSPIGPGNVNGLLLLARSEDFDNLDPILSPIHSRGHWVSFLNDFIRTVDPIAVQSAETVDRWGDSQTYSPLRSAASWTNPEENPGVTASTTVWFVCPNSNVYGTLPPSQGFPVPPATVSTLTAVIFNNEKPEVDVPFGCSCLTGKPVATIDPIYLDTPDAQDDSEVLLWYTEVYAYDPGSRRKFKNDGVMLEEEEASLLLVKETKDPVPAFTGYRAIVWSATPFGVFTPTGDDFSRLFHASAGAYLYGDLGGR